jgi:hypothetical protein
MVGRAEPGFLKKILERYRQSVVDGLFPSPRDIWIGSKIDQARRRVDGRESRSIRET